ncbi:MAG: transglutaminase family protein [Ruminococcus sp.]|nr:transglutaminase family protein [Ruminococcus sp.]
MKKLTFEYSTEFDFASPISAHCFTLRCLPLSDDRQIISEPKYTIQPVGGVIWNSRDSFGNSLLCGRIEKPHDKFAFSVKGTASITSSYTVSGKAPVMYAYQSPLTHPGEALTAFYEAHQPTESNVLYRALALADSLYEYMTYEKGVTDVHTTAEEALTLGKGVCQDYAHIMLALCRMGGIPCRYVAGLACDEGETHAWVEVNDGSRWYGLDPVNNCLISTHYLKLYHGRDYADCPIESGCYVGITESTQTVKSQIVQ